MNTAIHYMYRDGANYKQAETVVVAGALEEGALEPYLDEGRYFIPDQVGLPELQERMIAFPSEDDHVWHELDYVEPTSESPTLEMTAKELLTRFSEVNVGEMGWDEAGATERLGIT